ncbi:MAG: 16S rRNA (guanine(966)-N(2))-methyltransferase RsmD [Deltaproteobacteria bacterium]|nr:16S rRNA (guanine(966)-N(2))-methyltransferase RsmD [Deltaproteobacteria bacterium]
MRITGGQAKGRVLASPKGLKIRPTTDQVREAIFNIIGQDLSGLKVLDLFAGTGSLGLESLSRGALSALFIDSSQQSVNLIKKNLATCGHQGSGAAIKRDLRRGITLNHPLIKESVDLVFVDPPYRNNIISFLLEELSTKEVVSSGSLVVAESSKSESPPVSLKPFQMVDTRLYGITRISIYEYEAKNEWKNSYLSRIF